MKRYDHKEIEGKWQEKWEKDAIYQAEDFSKKPKFYCLIEFPYPSGEGLHVGHPRSYSALDVVARKKRMQGFNVLYPIGWDAFGLPTENYAIKTKRKPQDVTKENIATYRKQLKSIGLSFDWSREVDTSDPEYYKWTQWIFLKLFEKGLAYQDEIAINWCPSCKIGLANEEVIAGKCERCGHIAEKRMQKQWMLKITDYAERLLNDLDSVDYLEKIKVQQVNWIGRSEGASIPFKIKDGGSLEVFTTRPDTIFGATYMVVAPEHELAKSSKDKKVKDYIKKAFAKSDLERGELEKEKTGVEIPGVLAINPANGKEIPVWVADYVLPHYGTGAIMAVPAHDERDFLFAKKFKLPIVKVVLPPSLGTAVRNAEDLAVGAKSELRVESDCYLGKGVLTNSGEFDGLGSEEAKGKIVKKTGAKKTVNYKLRDWIFSRQHYWGEPIPLIHCEKCGVVPVPEKDLPVELPDVDAYEPTDTGESPLAKIDSWVNVKCPKCEGEAKRETDTMPNWAGSSWYFLRYVDPKNSKELADKKKLEYWTPVDLYNGGMEHTTLHLLYSRFWHKFLFDIGVVPTSEPYAKRHSHGMVLAEDGTKMSKSKGNVVNPDEIVNHYGADTLRLYEMFMGPFGEAIPWSTTSMIGVRRFLERVFKLDKQERDNTITHKTIKKVTEDIDKMKFNTAISSLMEYVNSGEYDYEVLLKLLAPFAPHIVEELWEGESSIHLESWPVFDSEKAKDEKINFVIQVNGKLKGTFEVDSGLREDDAMSLVKEDSKFKDLEIKKVIFVPDRLINLVV